MAFALLAALLQWIWVRGLLHRAIFDAAQFVLTAGAAALVFRAGESFSGSQGALLAAAFLAGVVYTAVNHAFVCLAIGLSESQPIPRVWRDRFHWARFHYLAFGPLAFAAAAAYDSIGIVGLVAFSLPPALLLLSVRQYLERTRAARGMSSPARPSG